MLENRDDLSSEQPCKLISFDVALNIVGVETIRSENLRLQSTQSLKVIQLEFSMKGRLATVEILSSVVGDSQISLIQCWRHILAAVQLAVSSG